MAEEDASGPENRPSSTEGRDILAEPDGFGVDTLRNLGPLGPLAGIWEGAGSTGIRSRRKPRPRRNRDGSSSRRIDPLLQGLRDDWTSTLQCSFRSPRRAGQGGLVLRNPRGRRGHGDRPRLGEAGGHDVARFHLGPPLRAANAPPSSRRRGAKPASSGPSPPHGRVHLEPGDARRLNLGAEYPDRP